MPARRFLYAGTAALVLTFCAAPCRAVAYRGEASLKRNAALMKAGDYRGAMIGFLDMVLRDPADSAAGDYLKQAAEGALEQEHRTVAAERGTLLAGSVEARRELDVLDAARDRRISAWKESFFKVRSLASGVDTVREAVLAYERLLAGTPVYLDNSDQFFTMTTEIKAAFYKTIKNRYPYLVEGQTTVDERDLAMLFFAEESAGDVAGRYVRTGQTQSVLDKSERFRRLESEIPRHYDRMEKGCDLYVRGRYAEAIEAFRVVLTFDPRNEEALFFTAHAEQRLEEAATPVSSKQDKR